MALTDHNKLLVYNFTTVELLQSLDVPTKSKSVQAQSRFGTCVIAHPQIPSIYFIGNNFGQIILVQIVETK